MNRRQKLAAAAPVAVAASSGAPAKVKLTITREDQQLHSGELAPTYVTSRPNGPGCEPECRGANAEVALP